MDGREAIVIEVDNEETTVVAMATYRDRLQQASRKSIQEQARASTMREEQ